MSFDDETISKIAKAVRGERINKVWKEPRKAELWGELGWLLAVMFGILLVFVIFMMSEGYFFNGEQTEFKNVILNNLSCDGLRNVWFELNDSDESFNMNLSNDIQTQIILRCLK